VVAVIALTDVAATITANTAVGAIGGRYPVAEAAIRAYVTTTLARLRMGR